MLFHTWYFVAYFLVVFPVFLLVRRNVTAMNAWLLAASYWFYGAWNAWYLILIAVTTWFDWYVGLRLGREGARKRLWLTFSLVSNLSLLAFFKYADFFTENLNGLLVRGGFGFIVKNPVKELIASINHAFPSAALQYMLPVGISFFTFQSMSYTIDVYRGNIPVERSLLRFATFVSLFPQLVAGPIERASNLLPQLRKTPVITGQDLAHGASQFLLGLFKKVALADYLAPYVDRIYAAPAECSGGALLMATFAFAWQIYFDFSGYTDMARGVGQMMGFRLMINFNNPYVATGLGDFWNRWHISLSTWFKDYVYYPLGGNRGTKLATYTNMAVTMLVSGFWHGAAWTFLIWGGLHALGRLGTRELERSRFYVERVPAVVKQAFIFAFVCLTWVFFRAASVADAMTILSRIFTAGWGTAMFPTLLVALLLAVWVYEYVQESKARPLVEWAPVKVLLAAAMLIYLAVVAQPGNQQFIYFQF
jgi:D-alanyl-lipoteichoic acid acyltransferase DltB (MBOAT superfamily)